MAKNPLTSTAILFLLLNLNTFLLPSLACPTCLNTSPPPPPKRPKVPPPGVRCPPPPLKPKVPSPPPAHCPIDVVKLDGCVDVLGGLLHAVLGTSAKAACCPLLEGVADADAGLCLCTAIKVKLLNINLFLPVALEVLVDCGKRLPADYTCPA